MGFMTGVWRMLGADDDDASQQIVEYPVPRGRTAVASEAEPAAVVSQSAPAMAALALSEPKTIYIIRPELDAEFEPQFSLKEYAAFLLTEQALVLDVNEVAALDELQATRIVDYLSGVAEAIGGSVFEVTKNIFIFTPASVKLAGDPVTPLEVN